MSTNHIHLSLKGLVTNTGNLFWAVVVFLGLSLSPLAEAQTITTGDITGVVTDQSGAIVPNSTISLHNVDNGQKRSMNSGGAGEFRFTTLQPGRYQLTAVFTGLKSSPTEVTVAIGQITNMTVVLTPEATATVVNVTEALPLLNAENGNLATSIDAKQIENLPAPGNDMTAYAYTTPGVTLSTGGGYGNFSAFGLPGVSNLFTINGTDNMDPYLNLNNSGASNLTLGSNEIAEVAIVMNGYTGQYGRQAGANVNYVTKSGSNAFHGNAAWYYNGGKLNANDFFNNQTGTPRPFAISNEWADSFGGPVIKNKLFFFVNNEGLRYVLAGGGPVYIPTTQFSNFILQNLAGSTALPFYQKGLGLYAGSSGAARATPVTDAGLGCGDIVPAEGAPTDPGALAAYNAGFGTSIPCARTFRSTVNNLNTEWLLQAKGDYNITNNDRIYLRYNVDHGVQATGTDPINSAFNANSVQPSWGGQFGYTKVIGPNMVNQLLLSGSYYTAIFGPPNLNAALSVFPTTFTFTDGEPFSNLGGSDTSYPQGRKVRQWQLVDDFSLSHGAHTFKFGGNIRDNFVATYAYGANTSGLFTFNSMTDFIDGSLGNGSTYSQAFAGIGAENLKMYSEGFYAQDEWRLRSNLMVTLAIRLDRNSNITCSVGCFNELGQPFAALAHTVTTPYNATIQSGLKTAFPNVEAVVPAPRIGVAYNVAKSTVIRGGFGIFSDLYQGLIADRLITNSPAVASFTTSAGTIAPGDPNSAQAAVANSYNAFHNGFASGATLAQLKALVPLGFAAPNFNTIANKLLNPKYYEWNIEVQQSFGNKYMASLNYVGNHGYDEINQTLFANSYAPTGFQGLPTTAPDARFGEIRELNNAGWSNYDGLVAAFKWRPSSDFSGTFSYTLGHSLDTCSNSCLEPFNALTAVSLRYQISPLGLNALNYGNSDYDVRHSLSANYVYTLSPRHFSNSILKQVLGGWTAAGTVFYHTGYPFSVVNSAVRSVAGVKNASGIATQPFLADYLGGLSSNACTTPSDGNYSCFSTSAFAAASAQTNYGNLARNSFRGPGYFDTDLNVNRVFAFRERIKLMVGTYFFNVFNHPNFDLPVNNLASGSFGQIQSTVSAPSSAYGSFQGSAVSGRVIQTQVKLTF